MLHSVIIVTLLSESGSSDTDSVSDGKTYNLCIVVYTQIHFKRLIMANSKEKSSNLELLITRLVDELSQVNEKLDSLIALNGEILKLHKQFQSRVNDSASRTGVKLEPDAMALLSLPLSLRKTLIVLYKLERATAVDLAKETKRLRAVESASANQLVRMGYLGKEREGREVYFFIESAVEGEE
jgi:hypothetical protein